MTCTVSSGTLNPTQLNSTTKLNTNLSNDIHRFICFYTTCKTLRLSVFNKELLSYLLCSTNIEASALSTKRKRTDLALANKVKVVNMLAENKPLYI